MVTLAPESEQSEFNAAIEHLRILKDIKRELVNATLRHSYEHKYNSLTAYFLNLVSVMDDKDDAEQKLNWDDITVNYHEFIGLKDKGKGIPFRIWHSFIRWEIDLRNIEQKYGLALPKKADARWALAGGR